MGKSASHCIHPACTSPDTLSSQSNFCSHKARRSFLAMKTKWEAMTSGPYFELVMDRIDLLVGLISWISLVLNPIESFSTFHWTPKALSDGSGYRSRFKGPMVLLLFDFGIESITLRSLDVHFVKWKPPLLQRLVRLWNTSLVCSVVIIDTKQSSTSKLFLTMLIISGFNYCSLSLVVCCKANSAQLGDAVAPKGWTSIRYGTGCWSVSPPGHQRNRRQSQSLIVTRTW